jgi:uncharacterized membrane protein
LLKEIRSTVSSFPTDLAIVKAYVIVAALTLTYLSLGLPLRAILAMPLLLFVPGYALVAAIYPRCIDCGRSEVLFREEITDTDTGLHVIERMFLSIGMSVAVLPILGVLTWAAVGEISTEIVLFGVSAFTLGAITVGAFRRTNLTAAEQFCIKPSRGIRRFRSWLVGPSTRETAVNVLLVGAIVLSVSTLTFAFVVPITGESYTSAMLVTEQDGEFVAGNYPTSFTAGEPETLTLTLSNHEGETTGYTVVTTVERVDRSGGDITIVEQSELDRSTMRLASDETVREQYTLAPELTGENLRLSYYVYRGQAPVSPNDDSAYRNLHLWITVVDS